MKQIANGAMLPLFAAAIVTVDGGGAGVAGARLTAETVRAWTAYVQGVEHRRASEEKTALFLALDHAPHAAADRRAVLAGDTVVRQVDVTRDGTASPDIPSGLIHHWRGAVFIPRTTAAAVMSELRRPPPADGRDVVASSVLAHGPGWMQVYLRVRRTRVVTAVYDTEHHVRMAWHGAGRASSTSVASRIAELEHPGLPTERERPVGEDRGFLWRLNAYWRYEDVPNGVIAECESISLSRGVPIGLGLVAGPIIRSAGRESMESALAAFSKRFR